MLKDSKTTVLSRLPGFEPTGGFAAKPGPRRLNETVAHQLAVLIIGGKLKPGETLPKEDAFAAALSVSRTAYREAVRMLTAKGLLTAKPRAGTRVLPREQWSLLDPDVLAWHLEVEPSRSFSLSLFELR